ncbi:MAG: hypothetical protein A2Z11_02855 [Candidatus Woykebacteria bacterium RBG_16_43_9]|uniref:Fimbrial assembly protein n=1 Tax=Candidatus Woykebacteria bacterium RBG_16_43_9 TaxID=1802596 RepID=A0A1G1WC59_9BACT|nr:MAG: hypothetical protein A2Z11_02855 [Candidatus Woykebacteria bacterium RBG_16_43_9]
MNLPFGKKSKEKNINLLPEESSEAFSIKKDLVLALITPFATIILLAIVFATLFLLEKQQAIKNTNINKEINEKTAEWKKFASTANAIKSIKTNYDLHQNQTDQNKQFIESIKDIQGTVPNTVIISKLDIDNTGAVSVDGTATNPATVYQFFEVLKSKPEKFENTTLKSIGLSDDKTGKGKYNFSISVTVKSK